MTNRTVLHFLDDTLKALESIEKFVNKMSFKNFKEDEKTIRATERKWELLENP